MGVFWFIAFILFIKVASNLLRKKHWLYMAIIAVFLSQYLIIMAWEDAKYATIINLIILVVAILDANKKQYYKVK